MLTEPKLVTTIAQVAAVVHFTIPRHAIGKEMDAAIEEVLNALASQQQSPAGPLFAHHLTQSSERFDCEVGFPINAAITPTGRVKMSELPGTTAVITNYTGSYDGLFDAWKEFGKLAKPLVEREGFVHGTRLWERYLSDPEVEANPDRWVTELYQSLVRRTSGSAPG